MLFFAGFQSFFLFSGWYIGSKFAHIITAWDHWLAFLILLFIGGKMVYDFFCKKEDTCLENSTVNNPTDPFSTKKLVILSVATSIDAMAVGVSLAFINILYFKICFATLLTALITATAAFTGLTGGQKLGCYIGRKASLTGGIILILIGVKILFEHLGIL